MRAKQAANVGSKSAGSLEPALFVFAMRLFGFAILQLEDPAVREIGQLGEREQIARIVAVRGLPVAFAVAVAALEGHVVESAVLGAALADAPRYEADADFGDGLVRGFGFRGVCFLRRHGLSSFRFGLAPLPARESGQRERSGPAARV